MARGIDEDDFAVVALNMVSTNMLGNTAGFTARHVGFADGVQERCFTVIDVTHDGNDGSASHQIGRLFGQLNILRRFFFVTDLVRRCAKLARQFFGQLYV